MTPLTSAATAPTVHVPRDLPPAPGVTVVDGGIEVSVYAGHADSVELCLFDAGDAGDTDASTEQRVPLLEHAFGWWFGFVEGVGVGQRYGFRVDGTWDPERGLRHNANQLLMDPYARAIEGEVRWGPSVYGHVVDETSWRGDGFAPSALDSAPDMPRCVVVDNAFDWGDDAPPAVTRSESVIYEAHVRNLTMELPDVPEELRGTYAGMAHPATIAYLTELGVTAVELLPVQSFASEPALVNKGLTNHWGYNTLGFFAPHAAYASTMDPQGALDEFKGMVKLLHAAGLEVLLDVVYNHTAEQEGTGATLSFRGLDNRAYYRLDERGRDIDVTGTGNTLDLRHPIMCRLVLDSLRSWVQECHVDGFRFDLAVALARGRNDEFDPDHPFLVSLRTDPVLSRTKLVVEPWDVGMHGWRTGQFPPPFSEWNDRFRDSVRDFWLADHRPSVPGQVPHGVQDLATRLAGSRDLFGTRDRGPTASVNFVAAHDGFTLADLTAYDDKHNEDNGEENNDGSNGNHSWNHGVEGPTEDEHVLAQRRRSMRNLLGTLLLSSGIPMINAGDEFGRTQNGNNNPYNQDNATTWFDWDLAPWQEDLLATTRHLVAIRREHPALRQRTWAEGREVHEDGSIDLAWYAADGSPMQDWTSPDNRTLQMLVNGAWLGHESVLVVLHGGLDEQQATLPTAPGLTAYRLLWDSQWERPEDGEQTAAGDHITLAPLSMRAYAVTDPT